MPATPPDYAIVLLADEPDLAVGWATLHWREWGSEPGREALDWWLADAQRARERTRPPVAFIARTARGEVLGGLGLHPYDLEERRDRSPWLVGVIVRADCRGWGIGQALLARVERWAAQVGIARLWVATEAESPAVTFYERCGYTIAEEMTSPHRGRVTVLNKTVPAPRT